MLMAGGYISSNSFLINSIISSLISFITNAEISILKYNRLKKFARFYIVTHCYTLLLQKYIIQ